MICWNVWKLYNVSTFICHIWYVRSCNITSKRRDQYKYTRAVRVIDDETREKNVRIILKDPSPIRRMIPWSEETRRYNDMRARQCWHRWHNKEQWKKAQNTFSESRRRVRAWVENRRSDRQCLNAFRYEREMEVSSKREFLRARKRPRRTDARSSPTFNLCRREGEENRRRGWRKPVSPGGRFGMSGREDFLGMGEREDSRKTSYETEGRKQGWERVKKDRGR